MNYKINFSNELYHFGIKGQKWGDRNGPPYPLDYSDHSAREKKLNSKSIIGSPKGKIVTKTDSEKVDEYRKKMLSKADKVPIYDRKKYVDKYTKATPEELKEEIQRRETTKKIIITTAAVVGVGAACYIAYKSNIAGQVRKSIQNGTDPKKSMESILQNAKDDMDFVLSEGHELHRVVGQKGFDLNKVDGMLYATTNELDHKVYRAVLREWTGSDRHEVDLKLTKEFRAPSLEKMRKIFEQNFLNDDSYLDDLADTMAKFYNEANTKQGTPYRTTKTAQKLALKMMSKDERYKKAMWAIVRQGNDAEKVKNYFSKLGYTGLLDYHDISDKLAETPIILFNAKQDTIKTGERAVTRAMKVSGLQDVAKTKHIFAPQAAFIARYPTMAGL